MRKKHCQQPRKRCSVRDRRVPQFSDVSAGRSRRTDVSQSLSTGKQQCQQAQTHFRLVEKLVPADAKKETQDVSENLPEKEKDFFWCERERRFRFLNRTNTTCSLRCYESATPETIRRTTPRAFGVLLTVVIAVCCTGRQIFWGSWFEAWILWCAFLTIFLFQPRGVSPNDIALVVVWYRRSDWDNSRL